MYKPSDVTTFSDNSYLLAKEAHRMSIKIQSFLKANNTAYLLYTTLDVKSTKYEYKVVLSMSGWPCPLDLLAKGKQWLIISDDKNLTRVQVLNCCLYDIHGVTYHCHSVRTVKEQGQQSIDCWRWNHSCLLDISMVGRPRNLLDLCALL